MGNVWEGPTCERCICHRREYQIHYFYFIVYWVYCQIPLLFNHPKLISVGLFFLIARGVSKLSWDKTTGLFFQPISDTRAVIGYLLCNLVSYTGHSLAEPRSHLIQSLGLVLNVSSLSTTKSLLYLMDSGNPFTKQKA